MTERYVFFYLMQGDREKIREVVPSHVEFWRSSGLSNWQGGPFGDRSGGLILFEAAGLTQAQAVVDRDPFVVHGLVAQKWIKQWLPESSSAD